MRSAAIALSIVGLVALVGIGAVTAARPSTETAHLVSMEDSARALEQAGTSMQAHGEAMRAEAERAGDEQLAARGEHWVNDGKELVQRGRWLVVDPIAPSNLLTPPSQLSATRSWGDLLSTSGAMLHDPSRARNGLDLDALRWNGLAMQAEGRIMTEHGQTMAGEADTMASRHAVSGPGAAAVRQAAQTMQQVGKHLEGNGQSMIDYADRLRRTLGNS
ncbi:MAG: hypothetical protein IT307_14755 [Chloroflexi bacterium]|nr:hypothetical protein [Chloroflexota bacterium]